MIEHPILKFLGLTAILALNDQHNERMLAEGRPIPWWKRHLLFVILLVLALPVLLIGGFIVAVNVLNPSDDVINVLAQITSWVVPIGLILLGVFAYRRSERRWHRP